MMIKRVGSAGLAIVVAAGILVGCSGSGTGVAQAMKPGIPEGVVFEPLSEEPAATWIERGETFAIVTWGSGSCPPIATALTADGPDRVAVTFGSSPNDPCTADMSPTTHEFELPNDVTGSPVIVEVGYEDWPEAHTLTLK
ncbi:MULTISPECIES: hypothetical protein [unclassified Microbacterium]|uniref:hypothetical protein n=1 Tax=unclassified Microbacterium TaxID=2609290 RepID=UPI001E3C01F4|nr:hypothetical protein [Microbacterium sp. Bi121]